MKELAAEEIVRALGLEPHAREGGCFAETYRADETIAAAALPARYGGERRISTAIYYLLTPEGFSAIHRLRSDEVYHFYAGDPVELLQLRADGTGEVIILGTDLARGMRPQAVVPGGSWQGSRLADNGRFALMGTTMAPGFDSADFEAGERAALVRAYPAFGGLIRVLTADEEDGRRPG